MSQDWPGQEEGQVQTAPQPSGGFIAAPGAAAEIEREEGERASRREQERLGRIDVYRKEFLGDPTVRNFREVQGVTQQIMGLAERESNPAADIALIISYMKALDPGSVVREGEFATAQNAGGIPTQIRNTYNQLVNGERLSPEQRRQFADTALTVYDTRRQAFDQFATIYRGRIQAYGGDPDAEGILLSQDLGFGDEIEREVEGRDIAPHGIELGFDRINRDNPFDRARYLEETFGVSPDQELRVIGIMNANRGNPGFTAESVQRIYEEVGLTVPPPEELERMAEQARRGLVFNEADTSEAEEAYLRQLDAALEQEIIDPESKTGTTVHSGASGLSLFFNDEITGAGAAVAAGLSGEDPVAAYQVNRDLARRARDQGAAENPGTALTAELIGGLVTGGRGVGRGLAQGGTRAAAAEGAKIGAVAGYGSGEGLEGSAVGIALGAPLGAAGGAVGDRLVRGVQGVLQRRAAQRAAQPSAAREVMEAAEDFNTRTGADVQPLPADVGGATTRRATGGAAQSTFGAGPIVRRAEQLTEQAQQGVRTIAAREGVPAGNPQAGGEQAIQGAQKAMKKATTRVDALYARARREAEGVRLELPTTQAQVQRELAEMGDIPGGAGDAATFQRIIGDLDGDFTVDGIKAFRKRVRDRLMENNLRGSEMEARAMRVVDAAQLDIEQGLINAGRPGAASAYAEASAAAAERFQMIDEIITPILRSGSNDRSGEQVFAALDRLSRGDAAQLGQFMRILPDEEAGAIRGLFIDRLGRATRGQQDADGQAFSLSTFLSRWNDESLSPQAKSVLFSGESRAALDSLARVAQGTREGQRFANHSNSAGGNWFNALINGAPIGMAAFDPLIAVAAGGTAIGGQYLSGRLLSSPAVARWLAKMPSKRTPKDLEQHVQSLSRIASADTVIAAEALSLQRQLMAAFEQGAVRAAADDRSSSEGSNTTGSETQ